MISQWELRNAATFENLRYKVACWARDRNIIKNSTPETQLLKAISEIGELCDSLIKNNEKETKDAIGDVLVCLINFCEIKRLDIVGCLELAYDEIKDRRGTLLKNGCFVKEDDFKINENSEQKFLISEIS